MMTLAGTTRIWLYRGAADMRKSFDGLAGMVRTYIGEDLFSGALFVFVNRRHTLVKVLYWQRDGWVLWSKRLERGTFRLPATASGTVRLELTSADLAMLLEGITPRRLNRRYQRPPLLANVS